jgi:hypothetical protein
MSSPSHPDAGPVERADAGSVFAGRMAIITCGALSADILEIAGRRGWSVDVYPLPPLLHNRPERIALEVDRLIETLAARYARIGVGYADCGTYSALDEVCTRRGVARFPGNHCYDVYTGADEIAAMTAEEPGTYFLTDFLVVGFDRIVWRSMGLDRYPELVDDYFHNYRRVVWLAGRHTPDMQRAAQRAAERMKLPLEIRDVSVSGGGGLEKALQTLTEWPGEEFLPN